MDKRNHIAIFDLGKTNQKVVLIDGNDLTKIDSRKAPNSVLKGLYPHLS